MDNKLPESENELDDLAVRRLLSQSEVEESPELLEGLRRLRSFRAAPAPEPSGRLAALLQGSVTPLPKSSRRRGIALSFALAGAMAAGASGVAASDEVLRTCESIIDAFDQDQEAPVPESPADEPLVGSPVQQDVLPGEAAGPAGAAASADPSSAVLPGPVLPEAGVPVTAVLPADPARITVSPPATAKTPAPAPAGPAASPDPAASPGGVDAGTRPGPTVSVPVPAPVVKPSLPKEPPVLAQPEPEPEPQVWVLPGRNRGEVPVPHPWPSLPGEPKTQYDDRRGPSFSVYGLGRADTGRGYN